jgi:hypothetical protein
MSVKLDFDGFIIFIYEFEIDCFLAFFVLSNILHADKWETDCELFLLHDLERYVRLQQIVLELVMYLMQKDVLVVAVPHNKSEILLVVEKL